MKKWLKVLFVSSALALMGVLAYTGTSRGYTRVCAEGEETSEVVEEPQQEEKGWVKNAYETYIVPIFASVSITSIGSAVACIVTTVLKNKQLDKKLIAIQEEANRREAEAREKLVKAETVLAEVTEMLGAVHEMHDTIMADSELSKETKQYLKDKVNFILKKIEENSNDIAKIDKLHEVVGLLVQLQSKVALQSTEVVKSGIIDDVNKILQLVKSI